jgi:hypothetical protein
VIKTKPHIGSTFESWLDEAGIREEVPLAATKVVIASLARRRNEEEAAKKARGRASSQTQEFQTILGIAFVVVSPLRVKAPRASDPLARSCVQSCSDRARIQRTGAASRVKSSSLPACCSGWAS